MLSLHVDVAYMIGTSAVIMLNVAFLNLRVKGCVKMNLFWGKITFGGLMEVHCQYLTTQWQHIPVFHFEIKNQ